MAAFLTKVGTPFYQGQSVNLPTFYPPPHPSKEEECLHRLDPRRAVNYYLDRTKDIRLEDHLSVGYCSATKGKALQKRTPSRSIILCIKTCYALAKKNPPEGIRAPSDRKSVV